MDLDRVIAVRNRKTVYRDGDDCIKVFAADYGKDEVLSEALNQSLAEKTGLDIPKIKAVTAIDGKWAIVSEFVKGKTLERLITEHPENKLLYIEKLADLQTEVQSKTCPKLKKFVDKTTEKISEAELSEDVKQKLIARLKKMPERLNLCHGDFNLSNVIAGDDGKYYILDWSHASLGDGSADAATTYLAFLLCGDESGAESYLEEFCKKSGTDKECVKRWLPIAAAARSVKAVGERRKFLLAAAGEIK